MSLEFWDIVDLWGDIFINVLVLGLMSEAIRVQNDIWKRRQPANAAAAPCKQGELLTAESQSSQGKDSC
jgi:hypothetical protein